MSGARCFAAQVRAGRELAGRTLKAENILARIRGLLGRAALAPGEGLWLVPCNSIHMFFMKFPIDAVFLDRELRVVRIFHSIQPWRMTPIVRGAHSCLEIAAGRAVEAGLKTGDVLEFKDVGTAKAS